MRFVALLSVTIAAAAFSAGCRPLNQESGVKIAGGSETTGHEYVRMLVVQEREGEELRNCTGTAVSSSVMLMASHCLRESAFEDGVKLKGTNIRSVQLYGWLRLANNERLSPKTAQFDLAVVVFPRGTFKTWVPVAKSRPDRSVKLHVVGYGAEGFKAADLERYFTAKAKKKAGTTFQDRAEGGLIYTRASLAELAKGEESSVAASAAGDSGGPLLAWNEEQNTFELVGITAGVYLETAKGEATGVTQPSSSFQFLVPREKTEAGEPATDAVNAFVDLSSEQSQALLAYALKEVPKVAQEQKVEVEAAINGFTATANVRDVKSFDKAMRLPAKDRGEGDWVALCNQGGGGGFGGSSPFGGSTGGGGFGGSTGGGGFGGESGGGTGGFGGGTSGGTGGFGGGTSGGTGGFGGGTSGGTGGFAGTTGTGGFGGGTGGFGGGTTGGTGGFGGGTSGGTGGFGGGTSGGTGGFGGTRYVDANGQVVEISDSSDDPEYVDGFFSRISRALFGSPADGGAASGSRPFGQLIGPFG